MTLGALLIPTLVGYLFVTSVYYTRYGILRDSGYHVLFRSAIAGCILAVTSRLLIIFWLLPMFPGTAALWKSYVPSAYSGTIVLSIILALISALLINRFYSKEKAAESAARESGDYIELLINESIGKPKHIELSLRSGKSYIGIPQQSGITGLGESDVSLIPIVSGYRSEDTRELILTTNYAPVIAKLIAEDPSLSGIARVYEYFRIVIPLSEIVSARKYDLGLRRHFEQGSSQDPA